MALLLILGLGFGAAAVTYRWLEGLPPKAAWLPALGRGVAWSALGLLLVNLSCPRDSRSDRTLVLLDGSLSMVGAGGRWAEARDTAARLGEVRLFGSGEAGDSVPTGGRSDLRAALEGAAATGRPVVVVTDGEVTDAADLPADLLARASVRVMPRAPAPDVAVAAVAGPGRLVAGDSVRLDVDLVSSELPSGTPVAVRLRAEGRTLAAQTARLGATGRARLRLTAPSAGLPAGERMIEVAAEAAGDREPRNDVRLHALLLSGAPGLVLLADPPDWDARALYRALADVTDLPVQGYVRLGERWHAMADLGAVSQAEVARSARGADLVVLKGDPGAAVEPPPRKGILRWSSGERGETVLGGDWYAAVSGPSPLGRALLGLPVDSFPPLSRLTPIEPGPDTWVALVAQEGRRGPPRPVLVGREGQGHRRVEVLADGLWRWGFRGGASEQAYRGLVAAAVSWLLGGADSGTAALRPARPVVPNGRPLVFQWAGPDPVSEQAIVLERLGGGGVRRDTLVFDGTGRAELRLPPGVYRYRVAGGGAGLVAVEEYSEEWLARPPSLAPREGRAPAERGGTLAREWLWLFGLCVAGLTGEWLARRRLGLR